MSTGNRTRELSKNGSQCTTTRPSYRKCFACLNDWFGSTYHNCKAGILQYNHITHYFFASARWLSVIILWISYSVVRWWRPSITGFSWVMSWIWAWFLIIRYLRNSLLNLNLIIIIINSNMEEIKICLKQAFYVMRLLTLFKEYWTVWITPSSSNPETNIVCDFIFIIIFLKKYVIYWLQK